MYLHILFFIFLKKRITSFIKKIKKLKKKKQHIFILHICRTDNSNCSIGDIPPIQGQ